MSSTTVTFSWSASSGATYYNLGVVDVATGAFAVATYVYSTSYTYTLAAGTAYKWNVAADNSSGQSYFTNLLYFQTPWPPPTVSISNPYSGQTFTTSPITVSGTATDTGGPGLGNLVVENYTNGSYGSKTLSGTSASYSVGGITLVKGTNVIDVLASDNVGTYQQHGDGYGDLQPAAAHGFH